MISIPFNTLIGKFRWVALLEGISFLLLLFVAMPAKYFYDFPQLVSYVGIAHGILFILYTILLLQIWQVHRWKFQKAAVGFICALVPFGTFWFDTKLRKE